MSNREAPTKNSQPYTLVLQGGGSLGAFQAGAYEALADQHVFPAWVAGTSIGAINAAIIAGNPPALRVKRLRNFWETVTAHNTFSIAPPLLNTPIHTWFNQASFLQSAILGVPDFFTPRFGFADLLPVSLPSDLSYYDTAALKNTLLRLIDFDLLNAKQSKHYIRLSVGAVDVESGHLDYFDTAKMGKGEKFTEEHILASVALPPAFEPVLIGERYYWDGGIVSNNPLQYVIDQPRDRSHLVLEIDLFNARGEFPKNIAQVKERLKEIQYASRTRTNTSSKLSNQAFEAAAKRLAKKLPLVWRSDPDMRKLLSVTAASSTKVMLWVYPGNPSESSHKDAEFSRQSMAIHWKAGIEAVAHGCQQTAWARRSVPKSGVTVYDLSS